MKNIKILLLTTLILFIFTINAFATAVITTTEVIVGQKFVIEFEKNVTLVKDAKLNKMINDIGQNIVKNSDTNLPYTFKIIDSSVVNAFALPGGFIYVYKGIIDTYKKYSKNDQDLINKLAGVLGHEISHVYLRHYATNVKLARVLKSQGKVTTYEDLGKIIGINWGYSRENEFEADQYGAIFAMRAGYDFDGSIKQLEDCKKHYGDVPATTHPTFTDRITALKKTKDNLIKIYNNYKIGLSLLDANLFDEAIIAFKVFVAAFPNSSSGWSNLGTAYLKKSLATFPKSEVLDKISWIAQPDVSVRDPNTPEEIDYISLEQALSSYERAKNLKNYMPDIVLSNMSILYNQEKKYQDALRSIKDAISMNPNNSAFYTNLGNISYNMGKKNDAIDSYKKAIELNSSDGLAKHNLAITYEKTGQKDKAIITWQGLLKTTSFASIAYNHLVSLNVSTTQPKIAQKPRTIGMMNLGQDKNTIKKLLGNPEKVTMVAGTETWVFSTKGIELNINKKGEISQITITKPQKDVSCVGINVGSSSNEVQTKLGSPDTTNETNEWIYKKLGLLIKINNKKVTALTLS